MTNVKDWTNQQLVAHALGMWANYIETGNIVLSANDMVRKGAVLKHLDADQLALVSRLRSQQHERQTRDAVVRDQDEQVLSLFQQLFAAVGSELSSLMLTGFWLREKDLHIPVVVSADEPTRVTMLGILNTILSICGRKRIAMLAQETGHVDGPIGVGYQHWVPPTGGESE
jgi:hypothetical protein